MPRRARILSLLFLTLLGAGCATSRPETVDRTMRGPTAEELFVVRSLAVNGREPSFDEKRIWEDQLTDRVSKYLRAHPELEQTPRYSDFRFWRQVTVGSTPEEVRVLLQDPAEQTIDPALMAAMAKRHWPALQRLAKEAWVYPPGWVIYFDEKGVVEMTRSGSRPSVDDD